MGLSAKKISGTTGREAQVLQDDTRTAHARVQQFVKRLGQSTTRRSWWWTLVFSRIAWCAVLDIYRVKRKGLTGSYFRARRLKERNDNLPSSALGPPPNGKQGPARYNDSAESVLYLSRSPDIAIVETPKDDAKPHVYFMKYEISLPKVHFVHLDTKLEKIAPTLQYLLLESEYLAETDLGLDPYKATQFLAFICQVCGVQALEYPSVRGKYAENHDAVNLVIFPRAVKLASTMMTGAPVEAIHVER